MVIETSANHQGCEVIIKIIIVIIINNIMMIIIIIVIIISVATLALLYFAAISHTTPLHHPFKAFPYFHHIVY